MPNEADHIVLANKNHEAMICLRSNGDHPEWVVTTAFYKALQVTQAVFKAKGHKCNDHPSRHVILKNRYPDIWLHYRPLWQASTIARYLYCHSEGRLYRRFVDYCRADLVHKRFIVDRLHAIEELAIPFLSEQSRTDLLRSPTS